MLRWISIVRGLLIMMGQHDRSEALFYYFRLEDQVPETHLLRLIERHISFAFVRERLKQSYSDTGRPSIDPELLLRILLIGYLYGITSERKLVEELRMHLAWRWFTGLGFDQEIPHHSTFSKNRHGRFQESKLFEELFEQIVLQCVAVGLVQGKHLSVDGSFVEANAAKESRIPREQLAEAAQVNQTVRQYLVELEQQNPTEESVHQQDQVSTTDPDSTYATKGGTPAAGLFRDPEGNLYGTTAQGGAGGNGTVFKLDTNNVLTTLYSFKNGSDGSAPNSKLVSINGELYGTTRNGGDPNCTCGVIFKVTKDGKEEVLYVFRGETSETSQGQSQGLVRDAAGNLYGGFTEEGITNTDQCPDGCGIIFKLDRAGVFTVLYSFAGGTDGLNPVGRLIRDTNGNIHGVTASGGDIGGGTVFRLDANGDKTVLHNFFGFGGGHDPDNGLLDVGGILYGTTAVGGDFPKACPDGCGVLYQVGKTGQYAVLHRFGGLGAEDGNSPAIGQLTLGADGSIYGAASIGGSVCPEGGGATLGCGVIFKYTP